MNLQRKLFFLQILGLRQNINIDFDLDTEENKNIRLMINTALGEIPLDLNLD